MRLSRDELRSRRYPDGGTDILTGPEAIHNVHLPDELSAATGRAVGLPAGLTFLVSDQPAPPKPAASPQPSSCPRCSASSSTAGRLLTYPFASNPLTDEEHNKGIVRRAVAEVINGGRLDLVDELYAAEV